MATKDVNIMVMGNVGLKLCYKFCPHANREIRLSCAVIARKPEHPVTPKQESSKLHCMERTCDLFGTKGCKLIDL